MRWVLVTAVVAATAVPAASALWPPMSITQAVDKADLVVVGEVEGIWWRAIRVSDVLKGPKMDCVALSGVRLFGAEYIRPGDKGIFFLRKRGNGYGPFHPHCQEPMENLPAVRTALALFADPGPFLDTRTTPENPDVPYALGELFRAWHIACKESPDLARRLGYSSEYERLPWGAKPIVTLQGQAVSQDKPKLIVRSVSPAGAFADIIRRRVATFPIDKNDPLLSKPSFTVVADLRVPARVGTATSRQAVAYLRDRLASRDPKVVRASLLALAKMRDRESAHFVIPLLERPDVRSSAIYFLASREAGRP